jgi:hypothetical protein
LCQPIQRFFALLADKQRLYSLERKELNMKKFTLIAVGAICIFAVAGCSDRDSSGQPPKTTAAQPAPPELKVLRWAPHSTTAGKGFNKQANGASSIWFELSGVDPQSKYEVWFGETQLTDVYLTPGKVGSAVVPNSVFEKPGKVTVYVLAKPSGTKVELGTFEVLP